MVWRIEELNLSYDTIQRAMAAARRYLEDSGGRIIVQYLDGEERSYLIRPGFRL